MRTIERRVSALEAWRGTAAGWPVRWIRLIVGVEETNEQARARYEAEHGPLGDDVGIIYRVIVAPDE